MPDRVCRLRGQKSPEAEADVQPNEAALGENKTCLLRYLVSGSLPGRASQGPAVGTKHPCLALSREEKTTASCLGEAATDSVQTWEPARRVREPSPGQVHGHGGEPAVCQAWVPDRGCRWGRATPKWPTDQQRGKKPTFPRHLMRLPYTSSVPSEFFAFHKWPGWASNPQVL